nr:cytochrome c oxidase subunit 2 [Basilia ansifera]
MMTWLMTNLQDSSSPLMEQLIFFHDNSLMIIFMITIFIMYIMINMFFNKYINRFLLHGQMIEFIWTMIPSLILLLIAFPSLRLLYLLDEIIEPSMTLKSIGNQWYWKYEYSDFKNIEFDSYMIPQENIYNSMFRLLEVDNRVILPMNSKIRMLVTSMDVIHSWTIPSLGVKIDGTPGRLNQINFLINRPGLFFGQCSEICGANHSFMPIVIESISPFFFIKWIKNF